VRLCTCILLRAFDRCIDILFAIYIGYIFQNFNLLPYLTPIENITLGCEFSKSRKQKILKQSPNKKSALQQEAIRLLNALGLTAQYHHKDVAILSIGQQQRVAAARAFIGSPELIIADEPTSALDTANRESFIKLLFEQAKRANSTLVFVSHDETLKPLFNRAISLVSLQEPL
jgi:putative ABC transport system ATP-binding protein